MVKSEAIKLLLAMISITLWLYIYIRLRVKKVYAFAFMVGSLGFFTIGIFFFRDILEALIINIELQIFEVMKRVLYSLEIFIQNRTIIIKTESVIKAITLNYECSGLIEMLVYSSIVLFYPIHNKWNKIKKISIGNLIILSANMMRLFLMVISVGFLGVETFEIVHLLIARIIFYIIIVSLYYKVLTEYHISRYREV